MCSRPSAVGDLESDVRADLDRQRVRRVAIDTRIGSELRSDDDQVVQICPASKGILDDAASLPGGGLVRREIPGYPHTT